MFVKALRLKKVKVGLGESFNLSYHMINSGGKYAISSHNVLICLSKLLN